MSTRQSIVYAGGLHIYNECNSNEICLEYEPEMFILNKRDMPKKNEKYGSLVIEPKDLEIIYLSLRDYFEKDTTNDRK